MLASIAQSGRALSRLRRSRVFKSRSMHHFVGRECRCAASPQGDGREFGSRLCPPRVCSSTGRAPRFQRGCCAFKSRQTLHPIFHVIRPAIGRPVATPSVQLHLDARQKGGAKSVNNATVLNTDFLYLGETTFARTQPGASRPGGNRSRLRRGADGKREVPNSGDHPNALDGRLPPAEGAAPQAQHLRARRVHVSILLGDSRQNDRRPRSAAKQGGPVSWGKPRVRLHTVQQLHYVESGRELQKLIRLAFRPLLRVIEVGTWTLKFCS